MAHLQLASSKISPELMDRLKRFTESTGSTQSATIRQAIEQFLDNAELTGFTELTTTEDDLKPSQLVVKVNAVDSRLTDIESRLEVLERRSNPPTSPDAPIATPKNKPKSKKAPAPAPAPIAIDSGDRLTVKDAFKELGNRGYTLGRESLRRALKPAIESTGIVPDELLAFGLTADFDVKRAAKSSASNTKWLYFN